MTSLLSMSYPGTFPASNSSFSYPRCISTQSNPRISYSWRLSSKVMTGKWPDWPNSQLAGFEYQNSSLFRAPSRSVSSSQSRWDLSPLPNVATFQCCQVPLPGPAGVAQFANREGGTVIARRGQSARTRGPTDIRADTG